MGLHCLNIVIVQQTKQLYVRYSMLKFTCNLNLLSKSCKAVCDLYGIHYRGISLFTVAYCLKLYQMRQTDAANK